MDDILSCGTTLGYSAYGGERRITALTLVDTRSGSSGGEEARPCTLRLAGGGSFVLYRGISASVSRGSDAGGARAFSRSLAFRFMGGGGEWDGGEGKGRGRGWRLCMAVACESRGGSCIVRQEGGWA